MLVWENWVPKVKGAIAEAEEPPRRLKLIEQ